MFRWLDGFLVLVIVGSLTLAALDTLDVWDVRQAMRGLAHPAVTVDAGSGAVETPRAMTEGPTVAERHAAPEPRREPVRVESPDLAPALDPGSQPVPDPELGETTPPAPGSPSEEAPATSATAASQVTPAREPETTASPALEATTDPPALRRPGATGPATGEVAEEGEVDAETAEATSAGSSIVEAPEATGQPAAAQPEEVGADAGNGEHLPPPEAGPDQPSTASGSAPVREPGSADRLSAEAPVGADAEGGPKTGPQPDRAAGAPEVTDAPEVTAAAAGEPAPEEPVVETDPSSEQQAAEDAADPGGGERGQSVETGVPTPGAETGVAERPSPPAALAAAEQGSGQAQQPAEPAEALASRTTPASVDRDVEANLQLGIYTDETNAEIAAEEAAARFRSILGTNAVSVVALERGAGTLFRLMSGPYASVSQAQEICGEIVRGGGDCLVVLREGAAPASVPAKDAAEVAGREAVQGATPADQDRPGPRAEGARSFVTTPAIGLNYRSGPSLEAEKLGALPEGTVVELLSESDGWARVRLPNGQSAYIVRRAIRPVE